MLALLLEQTLYSDKDKYLFKLSLTHFYTKQLSNKELISLVEMLSTFVTMSDLFPVYQDWVNHLKKELKDDDIRIAMAEERSERDTV